MKRCLFSLVQIALFLSALNSSATVISSCKKRNPKAYTSYLWVELDQAPNGDLSFIHGIGIDTQMLEVYFQSPVKETSLTQFSWTDPEYSLEVTLADKRLSFTLKSRRQSIQQRDYHCTSLSLKTSMDETSQVRP